MDGDQEEPYEAVIFRNSQIVYPPDLAGPLTAHQGRAVSTENRHGKATRARDSVLKAFDPVLQRQSAATGIPKPKNSELLGQIDFTAPTSSPPPLPKRNASIRIHQYDSVAIDDGQCQVQARAIEGCLVSSEEEAEPLPSPSTPTKKTPSKVRGLLNRVNNDFVNSFRRLSPASRGADVTDCPSSRPTKDAPVVGLGHAGMISWSVGGSKKDPQSLWTELKNGTLSSFVGQTGDIPVHVLTIGKLISISGAEDSLSFDVVTAKEKGKTTLTTCTSRERSKWMEWMLENVSEPVAPFNEELRKCFIRCGRVIIKDGVSGEWQVAWLLIQASAKRLWINRQCGSIVCEDLRKVRSISKMKTTDMGGCPNALPSGAPLVIHWSDQHTTYIRSDLKAETDEWYHLCRRVALQSGDDLDEQQLTADDVPVLVECCIKFIETYGMLTEGIYRRSGVQSKINRLLNGLKNDAWNVHISSEDFTEHDVANVLKRFFRTLPEPLLTNELYSQWMDGLSADIDHERQLELYKKLLESLPLVNRRTLRKLLGHLHAVQNKCEKNLMTVSNLAALWGPNLMTVESARDHTSTFSHTNAETDVVLQLIQYYPWLFDVDREKLAVNDQISEVQERLEQGAFAKKSAGDIRTWIFSELADQDVAVEIGPKVAVYDVLPTLRNLTPQTKPGAVLMESVCRGELRRPLHCKDLLLPTILKWADWLEEDRKDNQLVFGHQPVIDQLLGRDKSLTPKSMFEILYSSPKSKSFRQCPFEFCQARFTLLKDPKNHTVHGRWDLENIIWYLGGDSRRHLPNRWCITFIERDTPLVKKSRLFFGHCLAFPTESDYLTFLTSLILTEFEGGVTGFLSTPSPVRRNEHGKK